IPRPVGFFRIGEDDAGALILLVGAAPDVPVAGIAGGLAAPRPLEPRMLVGGMIDDQLGDHAKPAALRLDDEAAKILHRPEIGIDAAVIGNVEAVIAARTGIER